MAREPGLLDDVYLRALASPRPSLAATPNVKPQVQIILPPTNGTRDTNFPVSPQSTFWQLVVDCGMRYNGCIAFRMADPSAHCLISVPHGAGWKGGAREFGCAFCRHLSVSFTGACQVRPILHRVRCEPQGAEQYPQHGDLSAPARGTAIDIASTEVRKRAFFLALLVAAKFAFEQPFCTRSAGLQKQILHNRARCKDDAQDCPHSPIRKRISEACVSFRMATNFKSWNQQPKLLVGGHFFLSHLPDVRYSPRGMAGTVCPGLPEAPFRPAPKGEIL